MDGGFLVGCFAFLCLWRYFFLFLRASCLLCCCFFVVVVFFLGGVVLFSFFMEGEGKESRKRSFNT